MVKWVVHVLLLKNRQGAFSTAEKQAGYILNRRKTGKALSIPKNAQGKLYSIDEPCSVLIMLLKDQSLQPQIAEISK